MVLTGPEHQHARLPVIGALGALGWTSRQILWKPEWRVPQSPSEATKREGGHSFKGWPVDLVLFEDPEAPLDWQNVLGLFEFKKPNMAEGVSQLEIYLSREPRARFGVWSDGTASAIVWKLPDGTTKVVRHKTLQLPRPEDDFTKPASKAITWDDLTPPSEQQLRMSFKATLDLVVARDSRVTRPEERLNQLCNMLLLKLESDTEARIDPRSPAVFQVVKDEATTAEKMRRYFLKIVEQRDDVFMEERSPELKLDDHTIADIVFAWSGWNMLEVGAEAVSNAFQVFRRANLKAGEGQYFTPARVITATVNAMEIQPGDKIIDPACGTGGFLIESYRQMAANGHTVEQLRPWAKRNLYGVDKDDINVKLTRAMMMVLGDGSTNTHIGDSIRGDRWAADYPSLSSAMRDGAFSVVLTNPPFGERLKVVARDCEVNEYSISRAAGGGSYKDIEIGLVFLERAHRLLMMGGRVGIILPETYFFSSSYSFLSDWLAPRFTLRGVVNIPMEAFQGFCRAKTNLYIMEKTGKGELR